MNTEYPGVYCPEHIAFVVIAAVLIAVGLLSVRKRVRNEKTLELIIRTSAAMHLLWICINRTAVTMEQIAEDPQVYSWLNLIPYTFCGFSSLVLSLTVLFGRRDNDILHFIVYLGLGGGIATLAYPDFLEYQNFWDLSSYSSLIHHGCMIWLTLLLLVTGQFRPTIKKWYCYPIGYAFMMLLGLFELDALKFPEAINIARPLLPGAPLVTSWYGIMVISTILVWLAEWLWSRKSGN